MAEITATWSRNCAAAPGSHDGCKKALEEGVATMNKARTCYVSGAAQRRARSPAGSLAKHDRHSLVGDRKLGRWLE